MNDTCINIYIYITIFIFLFSDLLVRSKAQSIKSHNSAPKVKAYKDPEDPCHSAEPITGSLGVPTNMGPKGMVNHRARG